MSLGPTASRLWRAFYSANAYREVAGGTTGSCVAHLALAIALLCSVEAIHMASNVGEMSPRLEELFAGAPAIHIENGEARLHPPGRFVGELEGEPLLVLDPEMSIEEVLAQEQGIFLTRTHVFVRSKGRSDTRNLALTAIGDRVITQADLVDWQRAFFFWFPWILLPFAAGFSLAWRLVVSAVVAIVSVPLAGALSARLAYAACFRIVTLAIVPTLVLGTLATVAESASAWPLWAGMVCTLAFLLFGIVANRGTAAPAPPGLAPPRDG